MASDKPASAGNTATIVKLKVHFELNTPDGLRRVIFGLEKDTQGNKVTWTINFQLFERKKRTDPLGDAIVTLDLEVDKELHPQAEKTSTGMNAKQTAHALGPAADDAKAAKNNEIDQDEANETVQNTLKK
jgi:hypothetical protein